MAERRSGLGESPKGERHLRPAARRGLVAVAALTVASGAAYASTYSPFFAARSVRVDGEVRMAEADLRRIGGVDVGANVFHLDTTSVERRLLRDPRVAAATVDVDLPDRVTLRVVERIPVGRVGIDDEAVVVAHDGELLPGAASQALPEIRAVAGQLDEARRVDAARALAAMTPGLRRSIATVFAATDGALVLRTGAGVTVTYGLPSDVGPKAASLRAVLGWAESEGVELTAIDVSIPNAPTARTAHGGVTPAA